jgi:acyl-[acyl-carrier-protein]-phospholipid O-acyltransferase/long-chain-fatty-acid--[acyl-carrier-protein] ligase
MVAIYLGLQNLARRLWRTSSSEQLHPCLEELFKSDLPNLWKPRPDQFFHIDALPYLGTGKLDLRKAREIAAAWSAKQG